MRGEYTTSGTGLFGCLRAAAYGLGRPTVDEIWLDGRLVHKPRRKLLPTGSGRDEKLNAMAESIGRKCGGTYGKWLVKGHAYFDGLPISARWIRDNAIPHAESFMVSLRFPIYEKWMEADGEAKIAKFVERRKRRASAKYPKRSGRPSSSTETRLVKRPELMMLTAGEYMHYAPRTAAEEMYGVLVARRGQARITLGRTLGTRARHGHTAHLRVGEKLWMSTDDAEKLRMMRDARCCPRGSNAFVGGLGLGLIVLYLAPRCKEITVAEVDQDVIELVWPRPRDYCATHYPDLRLRLIHLDALAAVERHPCYYDYVFQDFWDENKETAIPLIKRARAISEAAQPNAVVKCWAEELFAKKAP